MKLKPHNNGGTVTNEKGYIFFCPGCEYHHYVQTEAEGDGIKWTFNGDMNKPTFSPSIIVKGRDETGNTICHSFVINGKICYLSDCTHKFKGQQVDLPEIE